MSVKTELIPFEFQHIESAAALLVARHHADRLGYPFLAELTLDHAITLLKTLWAKPHTAGVVALDGKKVIGYLMGSEVFSDVMGRTAWVYQPGYALAEGQWVGLYREMYAILAQQWVAYGVFNHYVLVVADNRELLDTWFSLSFGQQQGYGVLSLADYVPSKLMPEGITIREIQPGDEAILRELSNTNAGYQTNSPVFAPAPPEYLEELAEGYVGLLQDEDFMMFLAERGGEVLGYQGYFTGEPDVSVLTNPANCVELAIAGTKTAARGTGIGTALTRHGLNYMKAQGYAYCVTDWRVTNLRSSRFWGVSVGFMPVAYRLERRIDTRISWANMW